MPSAAAIRSALGFAALLFAVCASALPVPMDAQSPADAASASSGGGNNGIDFGEAGKLATMVDQVSESSAMAASGSLSTKSLSKENRGLPPGLRADGSRRAADGSTIEGTRRPAWLGGSGDDSSDADAQMARARAEAQAGNGGGGGGGSVLDQATPEGRNQLRNFILMMKNIAYHPATWILIAFLVVGSLVISAAGGRRK